MKRNMKYILLFTVSLFCLSHSVLASELDIQKINAKAIKLIERKQPNKSIDLLKTIGKEKRNSQSLYLLGVANNKIGRHREAISHLKKSLKVDSEQNPPRFELGTAYYLIKDLRKAEKEFLILKNKNISDGVRKQINHFLGRIKLEVDKNGYPKDWSVSADIGYMHDSNANAGTTEDTVLLFNLPFTLSEDSKKASDNAMKYNFALQHQKTFWDNWQVSSNVGVAKTDYQELDNFDLVSLYANTGVYHKRGNVTYGLPLVANRLRVGHEDSYYNYTYGLNPKVTFEFGKRKNIIFDNQVVLQDRKYRTIKARNGNNITYRPNLQYYFSQGHFVGLGGNVGRDNAKDGINSNNAYGVSLQYAKLFLNKVNIYLSPSFSNTSYKEKENAFDEKRQDKMYSLYSEISYKFKKRKGIQPKLSLNYSYSKNDSNLSLYEYDRQQVGVNLNVGY